MHMLACIKGIRYAAESRNDLESVRSGLSIKKSLLTLSLISTVGLVGFFLEHRLLCHRMGMIFNNLLKEFVAKSRSASSIVSDHVVSI